MQIYWSIKRKRLHKKRIQLPQEWFGTQTWPPFHCFGTQISPPWRHVKTHNKALLVYWTDRGEFFFALCKLIIAAFHKFARQTALIQCSRWSKHALSFQNNGAFLLKILKSKSGSLMRKHMFRFFTEIQKRIIDPNDPQRKWILWIIFKVRYFGCMIRRVSLLWIQKERIQPAATRNNFNTYSSNHSTCLKKLLIFTAIFELEAWIKRSILPALSGW